jgi:hypothetical protein
MTDIRKFRPLLLLILVAAMLSVAACDSDSGISDADGIRISGVVTDDATVAKAAGEVDDADVQARKVDRDGDTEPSGGQATTDSQGRYELSTSSRSDLMLVTAVRDGFESRVMVDTRAEASGTVGAVTMTSETRAEADVFVEARKEGHSHVGVGEVMAWVSAEAAGRIDGGAATAAQVAVAIGIAEEARRSYLVAEHNATAQTLATIDAEEEAAFRAYQTVVSGSTSGQVHTNAMAGLRAAVSTSGSDVNADARSREAARAALIALGGSLDSEVRFDLRTSAELSTALATRAAVDAGFQAMAAAGAQAVSAAGATLSEALASADTEVEIEAAWHAYGETVRSHLAVELGLTIELLDLAVGSLSALEAALEASLASAASVDAVVEANATWFTGAETALRTVLDADTNADAEIGAGVLVLVEVH